MRRGALAAAALPLMLGACLPYGTVEPGPREVEGTFLVEPSVAWNRVNLTVRDGWGFLFPAPVERWTMDGDAVDSLTFYAGIPDGAPLLKIDEDKDGKLPRFRSTMIAAEVMELFEATVAKATRTALAEARNLRPAPFGGMDGFRFELSFALHDEVERELAAAGAVKDGKLYLVTFQGDRLYHFERYRPEFERILASLRFAGG